MIRRIVCFILLSSTYLTNGIAAEPAEPAHPENPVTPTSYETILPSNTCCCDHQPTWTGEVEFVHFRRERTGSNFVILESNTPVADLPVFTATDFNFDGDSGFAVGLTRDAGCDRTLHLRYLEFNSDDQQNVTTPAATVRLATIPNNISFLGVDNITYESDVKSFELLAGHRTENVHYTYGFRYFSLDETLRTFNANFPALPLLQRYLYTVKNDLYGFQIGVDGCMWDNGCRLRINGNAKGGLYYRDASATTRWDWIQPVLNPALATGRATQGSVAFVGELGATANYSVSRNISIVAGYELLLVDGVSLAADQAVGSTLPAGFPFQVQMNVDRSTVFYHGLTLGLECVF